MAGRNLQSPIGEPSDGEAGFTLIEILVALTILGLSLAVLDGILGTSLDRAATMQREMSARSLALSMLAAEQAIPPASRDVIGKNPEGFGWRLHVDPASSPVSGSIARVWVVVSWQADGRPRTLTLSTLRPAMQAQP